LKATFAILFSLLLAIAPKALPVKAEAQANTATCCRRCGCEAPCCIANPSPSSSPAPAAPAPNVSVKQIQLAIAVVGKSLGTPASSSSQIFFQVSSFLDSSAVPLYKRNCTFLI